ncbi:hypothetical protein [Chenggangzhangella methanolivorans]|uniref:Uncharacterized protein n=1 Tax=Chenggangzhangella methanolivorans TaxID=1437009 RepID=A0A9E6R7W4_9HYPH|nr:hypothetical protein [Chenggangzhangella methanolivorans]QZN99842.1 hypothetical protein K6K41_24805 [Chenggangzhangella methanolivorans]
MAELVAEALPDADRRLHGLLDKARRGSIGRRFGWSSMSTNFAAPPDAAKQIAKAAELAELFSAKRFLPAKPSTAPARRTPPTPSPP